MSARQDVLAASAAGSAFRPRLVYGGQGARRIFPSLVDRFWHQVTEGADGCWLWTGTRTTDGYGVFSVHPVNVGAHRWAYQLMRAEIPGALWRELRGAGLLPQNAPTPEG